MRTYRRTVTLISVFPFREKKRKMQKRVRWESERQRETAREAESHSACLSQGRWVSERQKTPQDNMMASVKGTSEIF